MVETAEDIEGMGGSIWNDEDEPVEMDTEVSDTEGVAGRGGPSTSDSSAATTTKGVIEGSYKASVKPALHKTITLTYS